MKSLRSIVVKWGNIPEFAAEWLAHHKLRKKVFVDNAGWNVPECDGIEFDQYDTARAVYVIVLNEDDACVGCARMMPTTARNGYYSYMIKDANDDKLDGIPSGLLSGDAPSCDTEWEATRYTIDPDSSRSESQAIMCEILQTMSKFAKEQAIQRFIGLMPIGIYRMFRRAGYDVDEIGPVLEIDGRKTAVAYLKV